MSDKPQSMGCRVEQPVCSICGDGEPCEHLKVLMEGQKIGVLSEFNPAELPRDGCKIYELGGVETRVLVPPVGGEIDLRGFNIVSVGIVQAPACAHCGEPMEGCSPIHWTCTNEGCEAHLRPVVVEGVHPIVPVEGGHVQIKEPDDG